jgi:hypothetical protein
MFRIKDKNYEGLVIVVIDYSQSIACYQFFNEKGEGEVYVINTIRLYKDIPDAVYFFDGTLDYRKRLVEAVGSRLGDLLEKIWNAELGLEIY